MRSFQGAVLFVDMLGFSALTRGKLDLCEEEYEPWKVDPKGDFPHQLLAAKILLEFRKALSLTKKAYDTVRLAQLSDCAFLWSDDVGSLVDAGRYLMQKAALKGLLCRGGLAFGDIHEPGKVNHSLGAFIVGDAVTRAVTYETAGKGMRVFTDPETAGRVLKDRRTESFQPLVNPMTGDTVDEWRWYALGQSRLSKRNMTKFRGELERLVGYHTMLRYSPRLAWSATTPEGRRQIACSVVAVSDAMEQLSGNLKKYRFSVEGVASGNQRRSDSVRQRVHKQFMDELLPVIQPNQPGR